MSFLQAGKGKTPHTIPYEYLPACQPVLRETKGTYTRTRSAELQPDTGTRPAGCPSGVSVLRLCP